MHPVGFLRLWSSCILMRIMKCHHSPYPYERRAVKRNCRWNSSISLNWVLASQPHQFPQGRDKKNQRQILNALVLKLHLTSCFILQSVFLFPHAWLHTSCLSFFATCSGSFHFLACLCTSSTSGSGFFLKNRSFSPLFAAFLPALLDLPSVWKRTNTRWSQRAEPTAGRACGHDMKVGCSESPTSARNDVLLLGQTHTCSLQL